MSRYRVPIADSTVEVEAESWQDAKRLVQEENPDARVGMPLRIDPPGVPKKRSANSRYHLADVDKMGADGASPLPGKIKRAARRRRNPAQR